MEVMKYHSERESQSRGLDQSRTLKISYNSCESECASCKQALLGAFI